MAASYDAPSSTLLAVKRFVGLALGYQYTSVQTLPLCSRHAPAMLTTV